MFVVAAIGRPVAAAAMVGCACCRQCAAAVTGDTVGDPFKDTAGPSLHVVIKLLSTTVLVMGPLFVGRNV